MNHNLDAGDPSDHSVAQYSEKDVARAVKEAQEVWKSALLRIL